MLIALLVCLIPTTIGGLLSAIGIAGMDRLLQRNVLAMSGRAVEAAGDVDVLLLDKTGTITLGNRQAVAFLPAPGVTEQELADAAQLASLADETPEGRSIVVLAKQFGIRARTIHELPHAQFVPFTAQTRMSGVNLEGKQIRKGSANAVRQFTGGMFPAEVEKIVEGISLSGGTPLVVATKERVLGVIHLKDIVKGGLADRFKRFRAMGIRTVMITGDNKLTAAAIAQEAGVDDFLAEAKPEDKLALIRQEQQGGRMIAMIGDGTNDAPALAQADVGVAMNTGTQAAKEAGNMVDLDSNPTKLLEIIEIGKQLLITRGALTTFSIANDVAKYFAIIPAMLMVTFPVIAPLNVMHLHSPDSAILSAVIFNALIIIALIPLALRGVKFRPLGAVQILRINLLIYGLWGVILPFIGIKLIDLDHRRSASGMNMKPVGAEVTRLKMRSSRRLLKTFMKTILTEFGRSLVATLFFAVILCGLYPLIVYGVSQLLFHDQANGSLLVDKSGAIRGSALLAQNFTGAQYFHPRPSAAGANGYDATSSGGSNLGPTSSNLVANITQNIANYRAENGLTTNTPVPADAVTASGSGLDPDISPANAALANPARRQGARDVRRPGAQARSAKH